MTEWRTLEVEEYSLEEISEEMVANARSGIGGCGCGCPMYCSFFIF